MAWLHERHAQAVTLLLVTHDLALVAAHAQRVLVMQGGRLLADGPPALVLAQRDLLAQAGLMAAPAPMQEQPDAL